MTLDTTIKNIRAWRGAVDENKKPLYVAENVLGSTVAVNPSHYELIRTFGDVRYYRKIEVFKNENYNRT